jgi:hypothetical protein
MSSIIGPIFENLTIKIPVDTIHSVSNATRKDILKVNSKSNVVVIPNGVDLALYDKYTPRFINSTTHIIKDMLQQLHFSSLLLSLFNSIHNKKRFSSKGQCKDKA